MYMFTEKEKIMDLPTKGEPVELDWDKAHDEVNKFHEEFKALVRKYVPKYPESAQDYEVELLAMMQDKTSVYGPYIWSDDDGEA